MTAVPKRDFGTLHTEQIAYSGLSEYDAARSDAEKIETLARIILETFDDYYTRSRRIPELAKQAFEARDWPGAIELSRERIAIYSVSIGKIIPILKQALDDNEQVPGFWDRVEARFDRLVEARYERDLATAYLTSIRRRLHRTTWQPGEQHRGEAQGTVSDIICRFEADGEMTPGLVEKLLAVPGIDAPFRNLPGDAEIVADRINAELEIGPERPLDAVEVVTSGFYRNRGAYIVGALTIAGRRGPVALALLNRETGVEVDAVVLRPTTLSHVFSSTLANFHVTIREYHELVDFLFTLMPVRPRGQHYSTLGYNHIGKIAVMRQVLESLDEAGETLDHAPGPRGSVAVGFTAPAAPFVLKVIRDAPTEHYKWGTFEGLASVLAKYRSVHELNRSGSMLDNIIYSDVVLPRAMFDERFLASLLQDAGTSAAPAGDSVAFRHLIVQRKLVPLPIYLETCTPQDAETVVIRLGQCIRNNAAINVFNKDLDGRNYGVSTLRFVYLFDYDAVEPLTDVKVRTNVGREPGEEDIPDWFFEDGTIFLPEEVEMHLKLPDKGLRRLFREAHGELLGVDYWERMQHWLREGRVPRVRTYPRSTQLRREGPVPDLSLTVPTAD
jgi:isocitrate dehydrogenase kinase/phosphatase